MPTWKAMNAHEENEDRGQTKADHAHDRDEDDREVLLVVQFALDAIAAIEETVPFYLIVGRVFIDRPRPKHDRDGINRTRLPLHWYLRCT